jgi:hypothetical protein
MILRSRRIIIKCYDNKYKKKVTFLIEPIRERKGKEISRRKKTVTFLLEPN